MVFERAIVHQNTLLSRIDRVLVQWKYKTNEL